MLSRNTLRVLFWMAMMGSTLLLLLPGALFGTVTLPKADLLVHLTMMAGVTALGIVAYERYRLPMILGLGAMAVASEILQLVVPGRYFDLVDLAANGVGILSGLIIGLAVAPLVLKRARLAINR